MGSFSALHSACACGAAAADWAGAAYDAAPAGAPPCGGLGGAVGAWAAGPGACAVRRAPQRVQKFALGAFCAPHCVQKTALVIAAFLPLCSRAASWSRRNRPTRTIGGRRLRRHSEAKSHYVCRPYPKTESTPYGPIARPSEAALWCSYGANSCTRATL